MTSVDSPGVNRRALADEISVAQGPVFSAKRGFRNFIRLNAGVRWDDRIERALMVLGRLAVEQIEP